MHSNAGFYNSRAFILFRNIIQRSDAIRLTETSDKKALLNEFHNSDISHCWMQTKGLCITLRLFGALNYRFRLTFSDFLCVFLDVLDKNGSFRPGFWPHYSKDIFSAVQLCPHQHTIDICTIVLLFSFITHYLCIESVAIYVIYSFRFV